MGLIVIADASPLRFVFVVARRVIPPLSRPSRPCRLPACGRAQGRGDPGRSEGLSTSNRSAALAKCGIFLDQKHYKNAVSALDQVLPQDDELDFEDLEARERPRSRPLEA